MYDCEQVAEPSDTSERMQDVGTKTPAAEELRAIVPVGVMATPLAASITVTEHVADPPTEVEAGAQEIEVVVILPVMLRGWALIPPRWSVSPV